MFESASRVTKYLLALALLGAEHALLDAQSANSPPQIQAISASPALAAVGQTMTFSASATDPDGDPLTYSWDFNDGSAATSFSSSPSVTHAYANPGHYLALVWVSDGWVQVSKSLTVGIYIPPTTPQPTSSGTILYDGERNRVWNVNPDSDTVTAIDGKMLNKLWETPVGKNPRTLAQSPDGSIWVVSQDDATISLLDPNTGARLQTVSLPYTSRPYGIAFSPDGRAAYVTLQGTGRLVKLHPASRTVVATLDVCPTPRGIAISGDSARILVTRFISPLDHAEVVEVSAASFAVVRTFVLALDPGLDSSFGSRGVPNYLSSITITPDGQRAWVPSKKDNTVRGLFRDGQPLTFETTVRTIVSQIDLVANQEDLAARVDIDNSNMAVAVSFSPAGDLAFVALQGMNAILFLDRYNVVNSPGSIPYVGGLAPQGLVFDKSGTRLYSQNFMSRTVSVFDTSGVTGLTNFVPRSPAVIPTMANERLSPLVLRGKQIFYNANEGVRDRETHKNKMNKDGYITCASCHLDGDSDGRVWDVTNLGEGLRNTISLLGRRGTGMGRVHWTANFDEIQDFEHPIRDLFGGTGFLTDAQFNTGTVKSPLGDPKAGLSPDLDALAAYVSSLDKVHPSPFRNFDGTLTADAQAGKVLFQNIRCWSCHSGTDVTDRASGFTHDVGTIKPSSGGRLGQPLTGFGTPTLKGIWETAPYLHDGSAPTILEVLTTANPTGQHGDASQLSQDQLNQLVAYLRQIDESEAAEPSSLLFVSTLTGAAVVPPTSSSAMGLGKVVLGADGTTALVSLSLSGLLGTETGAHLSGPASPGSNGTRLFDLPTGSFTDFAVVLSPDQAANLQRALLYLEVTTDAWPEGELRGQLASSPIPDQPLSAATREGGGGKGCGWVGAEVVLLLGYLQATQRLIARRRRARSRSFSA